MAFCFSLPLCGGDARGALAIFMVRRSLYLRRRGFCSKGLWRWREDFRQVKYLFEDLLLSSSTLRTHSLDCHFSFHFVRSHLVYTDNSIRHGWMVFPRSE